jgi:hypothetical protein
MFVYLQDTDFYKIWYWESTIKISGDFISARN